MWMPYQLQQKLLYCYYKILNIIPRQQVVRLSESEDKMKDNRLTVKVTAKRSAGFGCIKGDTHTYKAYRVEDRGDYWAIILTNRMGIIEDDETRVSKSNWDLEIIE